MLVLLACIPLLVALSCGGNQAGPKAQDFQVTLFDGSSFKLSDQAGQNALVLNFWYPSCPPCREEMPAFQQAWQKAQGEDVRFLGLFVPQGLDSEQDARDFVGEFGLTYDFATDTRAEVAQLYEVRYFPSTIFIDKTGSIFWNEISTLNEEEITRIVHQMAQS